LERVWLVKEIKRCHRIPSARFLVSSMHSQLGFLEMIS